MTETFIVVNMSPARLHLLSAVASRWHHQIAKALNVLPDQILQVPLLNTYLLQLTIQPKTYSKLEVTELEKNRDFILTPNPNNSDTNILSLNHGSCAIVLFSKVEGITTAEAKTLLQLNLAIELRFRLYEFTLQSDLLVRMVKPDHKIDNFKFEEKRITLKRKQDKEDEAKQIEVDKNGESISNAVSSSILVVMQKFIASQNEDDEEKRADRERRRQLEEILENIKQEKDDSPLPTPSNLEEFERMNANHNRRTENAIGNYLTLRSPTAPARAETSSFMQSSRTFTSLLPPPPQIQLPSQTTPPQTTPQMDGATSLPHDMYQAGRHRTEEQLSMISDLSDRFAGQRVTTRRAAKTNSIKSDSPQVVVVKEKISEFLNNLAGNEEYSSVNLPKILQELTLQTENETEEY